MFRFKKIFVFAILCCIPHIKGACLRQYIPNFIKNNAATLPAMQKRSYLANLRSYERLLPNGIVQQLHIGSDLHTSDYRDAVQVDDWLQHVKSKPLGSCLVLNEAVGLSDKPLNTSSNEIPSLFLHVSLKEAMKNKITGRSIETRGFYFPGYESHDMTVSRIMNKLKIIQARMARKDKEKLIKPKELSSLDDLHEMLQPHMQKTIRELSKEEEFTIQFSERFLEDPFLIHKKEPFTSLVKVASHLMDNVAVVDVCTAKQPNIYLNMGLGHILCNLGRSSIDNRIRTAGWTLAHESNPYTTTKLGLIVHAQPVDINKHFKTLPPLGCSLTKPNTATPDVQPLVHKPSKNYKHTITENLACDHLESMCQGVKETSYHKLNMPEKCLKKTKESCYRCGFYRENSTPIPLSNIPKEVQLD